MTLREEIDKSRQKLWGEMDVEQIGGDLDTVIDRIDEIEKLIAENDFNAAMRLSQLEDRTDKISELVNSLEVRLVNLSVSTTQPPAAIPSIPEEVLQNAIEVFKATIAEKKRELDRGPKMERT